ncbi:C2 domain-containing protein [Schizosaccharomyces pombe]
MNCRRKPLPLHSNEVQAAESISKDELYSWTLKNVLILFLVQYRASTPSALQTSSFSTPVEKKTNGAFSGSLFSAKEKKDNPKYPKDFIKYLSLALESISMGKEPEYQDQLIRGCFAAFYNNINKSHISKQLKDSRKIEDMFLIFASSVSSELTKRLGTAYDSNLADRITASFIELCKRVTLKGQLASPSSEFVSHLDMYHSKLLNKSEILSTKRVNRGQDQFDLSSFPLLKVFSSVFKVAYSKALLDAEKLFPSIDEAAIAEDIGILIEDLESDACKFSHSVVDFSNYKSYSTWKARELQTLEQHRKIMLSLIPLSSSPNHPIQPIGFPASRKTPTYVPPIARPYFRQLLSLCLEYRLQVTDPVEVKQINTFIRECSIYWRILPSTRCALSMDFAREHLQKGLITSADVLTHFGELHKSLKEWEITYWPKIDVSIFSSALFGIRNALAQLLKKSLLDLLHEKKADFHRWLNIMSICVEDGKVINQDLSPKSEISSVALALQEHCKVIFDEEFDLSKLPSSNFLDEIILASNRISVRIKFLERNCSECIYGVLSLPQIFINIVLPNYIRAALVVAKEYLREKANADINDLTKDMLEIYSDLKQMIHVLQEYHNEEYRIGSFEGFFQPFIDSWLDNVEASAEQWFLRSLEKDNFDENSSEGQYSSSIVDLFHAFHQAFRTLEGFEWEDDLANARFFTRFFRVIYIVLSKYTQWTTQKFFEEANKQDDTSEVQNDNSSSWFSKARNILSGSNEVLPFRFSPTMCILLNNIHFAMHAYEELEQKIDLQRLIEALDVAESTKRHKISATNYLYTIKVVRGEGLHPDGAGKIRTSYIVLTDNKGRRIGKTRPIHSMNPRWDDTFEVKTKDALMITANLWSKGKFNDHEIFGRSSFTLSPKIYGDYLPREEWFDLNPHGELLLRIEMEGEREHIGFYVGRTYHDLERAQREMIKFIVNKMEPVINQNLSTATLKKLLSANTWMDLDKTMTSVTSLLNRTGFSSKSSENVKKEGELTDVQIEAAIYELLDYFDLNFSIIAKHLTKDVFVTVMSYVWDEVVCTTKELLLPPVSVKPINRKPLSPAQMAIVYRWLQFLKDYFYANGEGVKLPVLETDHYKELLRVQEYYDKPTDFLLQECDKIASQLYLSSRMVNNEPVESLPRHSRIKFANKEIYRSGTIRKVHIQTNESELERNERIILRILRMRADSKRFLSKHFQRKGRLLMADAMRNGYVMPLGHLKKLDSR